MVGKQRHGGQRRGARRGGQCGGGGAAAGCVGFYLFFNHHHQRFLNLHHHRFCITTGCGATDPKPAVMTVCVLVLGFSNKISFLFKHFIIFA